MSRHTVGISLNDDEYAQLKELAEEQDRYISGQARHMLRTVLHNQALVRDINAQLAVTHMAGAGSAPEDRTSSAPPVPSALGSALQAGDHTAKQKPLPG